MHVWLLARASLLAKRHVLRRQTAARILRCASSSARGAVRTCAAMGLARRGGGCGRGGGGGAQLQARPRGRRTLKLWATVRCCVHIRTGSCVTVRVLGPGSFGGSA